MSVMSEFGPGLVIATRTDVVPSTPINLGYAQELSMDFQGSIKELTGQYQYPLDVARGVTKVTCKAKAAIVSGTAFNNCFFGMPVGAGSTDTTLPQANASNQGGLVTGSNAHVQNEAHVLSAATITITPPGSGVFDTSGVDGGDLGVNYAASGTPLMRVASTPTVGQYSVTTAGVYTFSAADVTAVASIFISYRYTVTAGQTIIITNQLLGYTPLFQLDYLTVRNNNYLNVRLFQCTASGITLATKLEDFLMPEFSFGAFANVSNQIGQISFSQIN